MRDTMNKRLFWLPKRPHQAPQTKWVKEFVFEDLFKEQSKNSNRTTKKSQLELVDRRY